MIRLNAISVSTLDHLHRRRYPSRRSERGQALMLLLVLLGMAASVFVFSTTSNMSTYVSATAERIDNDALAQAKAALIRYVTITNLSTTRPGAFPCPDTDNNGTANLYSGTNCPGYVTGSDVYVGRLPWQTLGLPDLRDSSGERLWYAVSRDFARNPTCLPNCPDLTSNTQGQLMVNGRTVVAIIFAPGRTQGSQVRDIANENTASNYLDGENADGDATFSNAVASATFNDRLLTIVNPDIMPEVEQYVAQAMKTILMQYKAATNVYPWADLSDGNSNASGISYYNHWRFPCGTALPWNWGRTTSPITPVLPEWLTNGCNSPVTGWTSVIYYAVAKNELDSGGSSCTTCTNLSPPKLSVDGVDKEVVLITPGGYTGSPTRSWSNSTFTTISGYFEDSENSNNNDTFVTPTAKTYNRDRIFTIP